VWRKWLEAGGLVHSLLQPVRNNSDSQIEWVKREVERLSMDNEVWAEIRQTDRKVLGRARGDSLTGKPLNQIRAHLRAALEFARRWVQLQRARPGATRGYSQQQAEQLRDIVLREYEPVTNELEVFDKENELLVVRAGIAACKRALTNLRDLFVLDDRLPSEEPEIKFLLNADLLRIPDLKLAEDWKPELTTNEALVHPILQLISADKTDWKKAFDARQNLRDHEGTERIIDYLEHFPDQTASHEDLYKQRDKHIRDCQDALKRELENAREDVETAFTLGVLREADRARLDARMTAVEQSLPYTLRFFEKSAELQSIRSEIAKAKKTGSEEVHQRLKGSQIREDHPAYQRILQVINKSDILTANEYIDYAIAGRALPEANDQKNIFCDFFPVTAEAIQEFLKGRNTSESIIRTIKERENFCGVDLLRVPKAQIDQAEDSLRTWFQAKRDKRIDDDAAKSILSFLGLKVLRSKSDRARRGVWIDIECDAINDRNRCPIPIFGSDAQGRYRLFCVWDKANEEDLVHAVGPPTQGAPVLVFYFGGIDQQRRRDLARICKQRRRTFIVIDDVLILYLTSISGSRLPALFDCTLPFTFAEPYTTTAGLVPPEMFYGRSAERDAITDLRGSCFIYGGRQLGKTALLRDVARQFHSPQEGRIALWIDLKTHGIGYDRGIDDIWRILADEFKRYDVVPKGAHVHDYKLLDHIYSWLEEDSTRRILLLLDEADRFLESDARTVSPDKDQAGEFIRADRLKGLMDRTNRRFKVVFAGLHNVQRTTRLANHPLAHFGEAVCIGPLLDNGEWREARMLVERPIASMGFQFESPDLVTRILSQTNYYPSLIQLYCKHLLGHVVDVRGTTVDLRTSPPYLITSQHVEEAYRSRDLRKAIRDRFEWTLQLDQRYEVIAYAMACVFLQNNDQISIDGLTVSQIRTESLSWWAEGFSESRSEDIFGALLDEMVGLGILRVSDEGRYALRSPNVISLLGTDSEIERQLLRQREVPLQYEPESFRSSLRSLESDASDPGLRSPLTARQESLLKERKNGVSVIFGCDASAIGDLPAFLKAAVGADSFIFIEDSLDLRSFSGHLTDFMERMRQKDGNSLVLVSQSCPWTDQWLDDVLNRFIKRKSSTSFMRVVFISDPAATWELLNHFPEGLEPLRAKGVTFITLSPWHDSALRQWLEDFGLGPNDKKGREELTTITGNWPSLLKRFSKIALPERHNRARHISELEGVFKDKKAVEHLLSSFGLDRSGPRKVFRDLAALGEPTSTQDLVAIVENLPPEVVSQSLMWGDLLSLVSPTGHGLWQIDRIVAKACEALSR
jgi:hypothetical protein